MKISLLQWNIWYREDIKNIATFLKAQDADIVCLQELTINAKEQRVKDTPRYIARQLGYNYYHKKMPIKATDGTPMRLANGIFSRFPIIDRKFLWINLPKGDGGYDDEYRAYLEVTLGVEGKNICIGTTHMSYTHRFESTPNKQRETDLLVARLRQHNARFIFAGDLNALPGSYTISEIGRLLKDAGPDSSEKTWTTKPFSYAGFEETRLNWRLDYIFATKDVKVRSSRIVATDYSDHLPIRVTCNV